MEERLEALPAPWTSFIVEFPTYPKVLTHGREESQRVLFLCPQTEASPTELCLALFGSQILMRRLQQGEPIAEIPGARFIFVYAMETPENLQSILADCQASVDAPVLVARKANVVKSAQYVTEFLSRALAPRSGTSRPWTETANNTGLARLDAVVGGMPEDTVLWTEPLPEIKLVNGEGNHIRAAIELQDYRAEYACRFVLAHFQENINRDKMAEMVNLSPGYFSNLFRAEVGMSFSDYLIQVRIENAKSLLRRFDLSVEAISKQCGFNSLAHFSRTFKERCGLSPLKYRKSPNVQT